jgi:hypothetical protein
MHYHGVHGREYRTHGLFSGESVPNAVISVSFVSSVVVLSW